MWISQNNTFEIFIRISKLLFTVPNTVVTNRIIYTPFDNTLFYALKLKKNYNY